MNKAILVIDMPSCCDKCFALDDSGDYPVCILTGEQRDTILGQESERWIGVH